MHFHSVRAGTARAAAVFITVALAHALAQSAAAASLTLADAQRIAVMRSRQLAAQDAAITSSREMAVAASRLPDPLLRLGVDNLPVDGSDRFSFERDFMTMRRIGVMQEFTGADKRRLRGERFEREADRGLAEKHAAIAAIQRDTAIAWLERFYLERLRAAVSEQTEESRLEIQAAEGAYRGGRASQTDVVTARSSRVMLEDRLSELDKRVRNARAALARWTGDAATETTLGSPPPLDTVPVHLHTLKAQLELHPTIAVLAGDVAIAQTDVRLAQANRRADWSWELAYQRRGSSFSDMVSVGVSIPLQWDQKHRQNRELASKLALAERAMAQRDEALRQHFAEVQTMLNEWENGRERVRRYEQALSPLARERTQAALAAYRGGKGDLAAVLGARRNEIEVRAQALQLQIDTARIWAQLRYLYPDDTAGALASVDPRSRAPGVELSKAGEAQ
ncbi:MAG: Heavy metal efflux outer membrane protein [Betaproteobacteria bacterium]|nr:Heavy metal efflux outer membrane protein [Betaproteobacteria bacterium]